MRVIRKHALTVPSIYDLIDQGQVLADLRHLQQVLQTDQPGQTGEVHRAERQPHPDRHPEPAGGEHFAGKKIGL